MINTNNRMKEISENLRRDVRDLLDESANIVTGTFKNGLCTMQGIARRWENFTHELSGAVVSLFKPAEKAALAELSPEQEPVVTVMESSNEQLPVGTRMTLSEAEERIAALNQDYIGRNKLEDTVQVAIDYMMDGEADRYCLTLTTGLGYGSVLEQMQHHIELYLQYPRSIMQYFYEAPDGLAELLRDQFGPQLNDDLEKLANRVLGLFQQHCTITKLEQQFEVQSMAIPEKDKEKFLQRTKTVIKELRKAANTGKTAAPVQERITPVPTPVPSRDDAQTRPSIKLKLNEIRTRQPKRPTRPERRRTQEK